MTTTATPCPPLAEAIRACRGALLVVAAFSACINVLMLTAPLYMLQVFDRVLTSRSTDTLLMLSIMAGAGLLTLAALEGVRSLALVRLGAWLDERLGAAALGAGIASTFRTGAGSTQALRDLSALRGFVGGPALVPVMDAPWTPIFVGASFLLHPLLGWMAVGGAAVLLALAVANELCTRAPLREAADAQTRAMQHADSAVRNADAVEAMGMTGALARRWQERNARTLALHTVAGTRSGIVGAVSKLVRLVLQVGVLAVGATLVLDNALSPGGMIAASILLGRALAPVDQAIGSWKALVAARAACARLEEALRFVPAAAESMPLPRPRGELRCEGVSYSHPGAREPVLRGVGFELAAGKTLGLVGPSAAGKTTLGRLLVGNLAPTLGHVRLDGMDVSQWPSADRGQHVGYLPQDVELFAGTVGENIARMGEPDADAVIAAARRADVHDVVLRLPQGYETVVGPGGVALSGGQRQRIALARALYGNPGLVVLDEPNAYLDHAGMVALIETLSVLKCEGVTVVMIAHTPVLVRQADYLLVLGSGTVKLSGPMEQVIARVIGPGAPGPADAPEPVGAEAVARA